MSAAELTASDLSREYATRAEPLRVLRGVSLSLSAGRSVAIMGPSGSGKSTLLHILGTLDRPSGGSLRINSSDPFALTDSELAAFRNKTIGFVFQDHHLLPQCSALENVLIPTLAAPRAAGDSNAPVKRAAELLERVGLAERLDHRPAELSGGERQRVAIARALINQPELLLADEPTGNLDQDSADEIADLFVDLYRRDNLMLVVVTHNTKLAQRFDRTLLLNRGVLDPRPSAAAE